MFKIASPKVITVRPCKCMAGSDEISFRGPACLEVRTVSFREGTWQSQNGCHFDHVKFSWIFPRLTCQLVPSELIALVQTMCHNAMKICKLQCLRSLWKTLMYAIIVFHHIIYYIYVFKHTCIYMYILYRYLYLYIQLLSLYIYLYMYNRYHRLIYSFFCV